MLFLKSGKLAMNQAVNKMILLVVMSMASLAIHANELNSVDFNVLPGDRVELRFSMTETPSAPKEFSTVNPARIALDFTNTSVALANKSLPVSVGATRSVTAVEAQGRTRVVINLVESVPYDTRIDGNDFVVTIGAYKTAASDAQSGGSTSSDNMSQQTAVSQSSKKEITGIDFRRGELGEGRVVIDLSNPNIGIDLRQEGRDVVADFVGTDIPQSLIRKLDVVDFATPAQIVETKQVGGNVRLTIKTSNEFEFLAYQADDIYTIFTIF